MANRGRNGKHLLLVRREYQPRTGSGEGVTQLTDLDAAPVEGTRLGRYLFLREIAIGPLGRLYELRGEEEANGLSALGRVVHLSAELDADREQAIVGSAWEALELRHEHTLCVADVVFGKGWVTLVHDHAEGSLLRSLHARAQERNSTFPVAVALRIATDIIEGMQETRKLCDSVGIAWTPGGTNPGSLYLCGDGRTRSLDGQLAVVLLRQDPEHARTIEGLFSAPEVSATDKELDERTDVFAAGAVLWELLTGLDLGAAAGKSSKGTSRAAAPKLNLAVPNSVKFPIGLARAVDSALEFDPAKRLQTLAELKAAIAREGEVAAYAQVIDFTDALLHRESTLFRLALDPTPKLSDELRANKPVPAHREWALQLAKKAQFAPNPAPRPAVNAAASRTPAISARPKAPALLNHTVADQGTPSNRARTAAAGSAIKHGVGNRDANPNPTLGVHAMSATRPVRNVTQRQQFTQPAKSHSSIANRTLIGISATAAVTGPELTAAATATARVELPPASSTEAISEVQAKAAPEVTSEVPVISMENSSPHAAPVADQVLAEVLFQDLAPAPATLQPAVPALPTHSSPTPLSVKPTTTESAPDIVSAEDFVDDSFVRRKVVLQLTPVAIAIWSLTLMLVTMVATLVVQRLLPKEAPAVSNPVVVASTPSVAPPPTMAPAENLVNLPGESAASAAPAGTSSATATPETTTAPPPQASVAPIAVAAATPPSAPPKAQALPRTAASAAPAIQKPRPANRKRRYVPHGL
jgi:serine/threonine protein kinase